MFFDESLKRHFSAESGAFSEVTVDEAGNSQITLDRDEASIVYRIHAKSTIRRGAMRDNPEARTLFELPQKNRKEQLGLVFPKEKGDELRLYCDASFRPNAGDFWYVFIRNGALCIGFENSESWKITVLERRYDPASYFRTICNFCATYSTQSEEQIRNSQEHLKAVESLELLSNCASTWVNAASSFEFRIKVGMGSGRVTRVPYLCILPDGQTVSDGLYVAIVFGRGGNGAVAGFAHSTGKDFPGQTVIRNNGSSDFVDIDGDKPNTRFNNTFFNPIEIHEGRFDENVLRKHIVESLRKCKEMLGLIHPGTTGSRFSSDSIIALQGALANSNFACSERRVANFVSSLAAKPFIILTGNSGTGKTKIADMFVQWLCEHPDKQSKVVPVGADWTDNRNVLGFVNHLKGGPNSDPIYESTEILEAMLLAAKSDDRPYFIILDEMNLSHVERYFSDFLSAMESGRNIRVHSSCRPLKTSFGSEVPAEIKMPDNLFIIGTVNVDETTYMFSPKVLDRANVIEFRATYEQAAEFLSSGGSAIGSIARASSQMDRRFLDFCRRARRRPETDLSFFNEPDADNFRENAADSLLQVFKIMHAYKLEFGFRTMHEVLRFIGISYELAADRGSWSWIDSLDTQIVQKVMPKLHGSRKRIEPLLVELAYFCETGRAAEPGTAVFNGKAKDTAIFRESYLKLCEMVTVVRQDQFVSFI